MTQPASDLPLTPRQRLRWRRAMDAVLIDAIYGRVVRDDPSPHLAPAPDEHFVATVVLATGGELEQAVALG